MKYGSYSRIEDLKDWFDNNVLRHNVTEWILYHGHVMRTTGPGGNRAASQKEENMSQEDSWNLLENYLEKMGQQGGTFTVYMPTRGAAVGERVFVTLPGPGQNMGVAGFSDGYINEKIDSFKREFLLERRIEELENAQKGGAIEQIAQQFLESGLAAQVIQGIAVKFLNLDPAKMAGFQAEQQQDNEVETNYTPNQVQSIEGALARLAGHFPRLDLTLSSLADFVDRNPDAAKAFLKNMGQNDG